MRIKLLIALASALLLSWSQTAHAIWVAVPLEILADESDLIVQGKVTKVVNGGFNVGRRPHDVALVQVTAVLKNITGKKTIKQVRVAQPAAGGLAVSTDIQFRPGQSGIWLLTKDAQRNAHWAKHPSRFQPLKQAAKLKKMIAAREKLAGGKPVNGLVARSELIVHKPRRRGGKAPTSYEVRFSLKNISKKPVVVCNFVGHKPLVVEWTGPGNETDPTKSRSQHYAWLARVRLAGVRRQDFVTIPPGGVKFIGASGYQYGISFSTAKVRQTNFVAAGKHRVTVAFVTRDDGRGFGLKDVWTGEISAPAISWVVK